MFRKILPTCCQDSKNLKVTRKLIENSKQYTWTECVKCGNTYLKAEKQKKYDEKAEKRKAM